MPTTDPTNRMLLLLGAMADNKYILLMSGGISGDSSPRFISLNTGKRSGAEELGFPVTAKDIAGLWSRGFLISASREKVEAKLQKLNPSDGKKLSWYENPSIINKEGNEAVERLREKLEKLRAEIENRETSPIYLASCMTESYGGKKTQGVGSLYVILGETPGRWRIKPADKSNHYDPLVSGRHPNCTIAREDVAVTGITPAIFHAMKQSTTEYHARRTAAAAQAHSEIEALVAPIKTRLLQRENQLAAMLEDEFREIMDKAETDTESPDNAEETSGHSNPGM